MLLLLSRNSQLQTASYKRGVFLYFKYAVDEWFKKLLSLVLHAQLTTYSACTTNPGLTQNLYLLLTVLFHPLALLTKIIFFYPVFFFLFSLEIPVVRQAKDICICMFNSFVKKIKKD